jgi:hypothetical protein
MDFRGYEVLAGIDVGFRDPTAFCVIVFKDDKYYVVKEYYHAERTTDEHAEALQPYLSEWDIDWIYIDSAAQQTRFDWAQKYDISTVNANKSVLDGIAHVAAIVDNDRLIVDQECVEVLRALDQYRWDPNPNLLREKPVHDSSSHMADALRYALYSFVEEAPTF